MQTKHEQDIEQIKADNAATKAALANITNDIAGLYKKIADASTLEDLEWIKQEAADLKAASEAAASLTPDEPAQPEG